VSADGTAPRRLQHIQRLFVLSNPEDVLGASCAEAIALTGAERAFASFALPGRSWERSIHIEADRSGVRPAAPAARSALFAIHRKLSGQRAAIEVARGGAEAIFRGLACGDEVEVASAVPIVHRNGRLWGELVLIGGEPLASIEADVVELAHLATCALENGQRLAFARRDQDRLILLAEATDDALYDWDFDTREFWWGGGIDKLLRGDADPVQNNAGWKLDRIHPDDVERVRASIDAACGSRVPAWKGEYRFRCQEGAYIDVEDRGYFLRDAGGRAYRMIGSMRDISALKALLAREQEARTGAESASRAKDEFLAMLGHELRNPLAPIVTGLQLVRLRGAPGLDNELTILERQAQHLIRLVDDLLDISRIAHAKIDLKRERLEVAGVIAAAIETASPLIEGRCHVLRVNVPSRGLEVSADRARLAQAISNLLNNAAKYTEPGGQLTVSAQRDGDRIAISVRDTGMGITRDMLPTIFNTFVQERQALDRSQGGLGLGLSIVRNLIELHGGTVEAQSEGRGRGSEFTIRVPAVDARVAEETAQTAPAAALRGSGRRIMVVDDNHDAADLLSVLLERMGNTTRVAHDAHAALQMADEFAPEVAVLDIGLPVMDGYELARRLRQGPHAMRLIALTGYAQESDKRRAAEAGFDAHLVKPVGLETLEAVLGDLG
jgi:signal transduction histidine kinase